MAPDLEFKVDATRPWPDDVLDALVATDRVRTLDLKAWYPRGEDEDEAWQGRTDPEPAWYERLLEAFPDAVVEDPAVTGRTRPVLEAAADRLSWDAPVHDVASFAALPLDVAWCNVKPSRFGTVERLLDFLAHAERAGLHLYGGGQFELSVGRGQLHALAGCYYPDGPNDVAPRAYNDPEPRAGLPSSPLAPTEPSPGFGWRDG